MIGLVAGDRARALRIMDELRLRNATAINGTLPGAGLAGVIGRCDAILVDDTAFPLSAEIWDHIEAYVPVYKLERI